MSVLHEERQLSAEQRRALKLLAYAGEQGCTGANLFNHGFSVGMFPDLVLGRARYRTSRNCESGLPKDQGGSHPDYGRLPGGRSKVQL